MLKCLLQECFISAGCRFQSATYVTNSFQSLNFFPFFGTMDIQALVLANLDIDGLIADTAQLKIDEAEINQLEVLSCLDSLKSKEILVYSALNIERYILTSEGEFYIVMKVLTF